eukprot:521781-Amphidinium_carterae.1
MHTWMAKSFDANHLELLHAENADSRQARSCNNGVLPSEAWPHDVSAHTRQCGTMLKDTLHA